MPADYSIDPVRRLVTMRLFGLVRGKDGWDARERIVADPMYDPTFDELIDASGASGFDVTGATVRGAADNPLISNDVRRAMVAVTDEAYGIFRMFQSAMDRPRLRVFRSRREAEQWLAEDSAEPRDPTSRRAGAP